MVDIINWRKDRNFQKGSFDPLVREIVRQAKKLKVEHRVSSAQNSHSNYREQSTETMHNKARRLILKNNHRGRANDIMTEKVKASGQRSIKSWKDEKEPRYVQISFAGRGEKDATLATAKDSTTTPRLH